MRPFSTVRTSTTIASYCPLGLIFNGPVFDLLTERVQRLGPVHYIDRLRPARTALEALLARQLQGIRSAERQLLDLLGWLLDLLAPPAPRLSPAIDRAVEILNADTAATLTMTTVADRVDMAYPVFRRTFTRETGTSPLALRTARRMQTAANLLRMTTTTHRAIARELGYIDEFHFSRRFREAYRIAPSDHRLGIG